MIILWCHPPKWMFILARECLFSLMQISKKNKWAHRWEADQMKWNPTFAFFHWLKFRPSTSIVSNTWANRHQHTVQDWDIHVCWMQDGFGWWGERRAEYLFYLGRKEPLKMRQQTHTKTDKTQMGLVITRDIVSLWNSLLLNAWKYQKSSCTWKYAL